MSVYLVDTTLDFDLDFQEATESIKSLIGTRVTQRYFDSFKKDFKDKVENLSVNPSGTKIESGRYNKLYSFELKSYNYTFIFARNLQNKTVLLHAVIFGSLTER